MSFDFYLFPPFVPNYCIRRVNLEKKWSTSFVFSYVNVNKPKTIMVNPVYLKKIHTKIAAFWVIFLLHILVAVFYVS